MKFIERQYLRCIKKAKYIYVLGVLMNKRAHHQLAKPPKHIRVIGYHFAVIFTTTTLLIIFLFYFSMRHNIITDIHADSQSILQNIEHSLQETIDYSTKPLDIVSKLPQTSNFLSRHSDYATLSSFFYAMISESSYYFQFRLLDTKGIEQLRFDRVDDQIIAIDDTALQDKSHRYYFDAMKNLKGSNLYMSPVDYNMDNGKLTRPLTPTLRFAQAIYDTNQARLGYVVINIYAETLFERLDYIRLLKYSHLYLINSSGTVLYPIDNHHFAPFLSDPNQLDNWQSYNHGYLAKRKISFNTFRKTYQDTPTWYLLYEIPPQSLYFYEQSLILATAFGLLILLPLSCFLGYKFGIHRGSIQEYHKQLLLHANKDELTGLFNRRKIMSILAKEMKRNLKEPMCQLTIIFIDVNDLKFVNDTFGHMMGDTMLKEATQVLRNALRSSDYLARLGGDEFLAILPYCPHERFVEDIIKRCDPAFRDAGYKHCNIPWVLSYGFTSCSPDDTIDSFINRADSFMYLDKTKKKGLA